MALMGSGLLHLFVLLGVGYPASDVRFEVPPEKVLTVTLEPRQVASATTSPTPQASLAPAARPSASGTVRPVTSPLPASDHHYFESRELDEVAKPVNDVLLRYPPRAFSDGISGEVHVRLLISEAGKVDKAIIVNAQPEQIFDRAALDAAVQLRFSPALRSGEPVRSQKTIAIVFDPTTNPIP